MCRPKDEDRERDLKGTMQKGERKNGRAPLAAVSPQPLAGLRVSAFLLNLLVPISAALVARAPYLQAQTLDRVVAAIGNVAVTASDVEAEGRLESFLSDCHVPVAEPDITALDSVRDRLIDQRLLTREAIAEGIQLSDVEVAARQAMADLLKKCGSEEAFQSSILALGFTQAQLLDRLAGQQRVLRIVDLRLRPSVTVEQAEIEAYYRDSFAAEYSKRNPGQAVPTLAQVQSQIREILVEKKLDRQLATWLEELKTTHHVRVF